MKIGLEMNLNKTKMTCLQDAEIRHKNRKCN